MLTILFDGIAYGMVLFVLGCGLSVTMGLMNFVNLAHGAFAMLGGYVAVQEGADLPPLGTPGQPVHKRLSSAPTDMWVRCGRCALDVRTDRPYDAHGLEHLF